MQYSSAEPFLPSSSTMRDYHRDNSGKSGTKRRLSALKNGGVAGGGVFGKACSWRAIAIFFALLAFVLVVSLAFVTGNFIFIIFLILLSGKPGN